MILISYFQRTSILAVILTSSQAGMSKKAFKNIDLLLENWQQWHILSLRRR